ncbi:MAG: DUF4153 domain-containing protein [Pseudomonadota bacterium]
MSNDPATSSAIVQGRGVLAVAGALAGLSVWALIDVVPDWTQNDRLILALATFSAAFFIPFLAMTGPLRAPRAALGALVVAVPLTVLMTTASLRFDTVEAFAETGHPLIALALAIIVPVPFLIAGLGPRRAWAEYADLFDAAWALLVRGIAAGLFLGAFWALIALSNALLGLVGIEAISWILEIDPAPYVLTGLMLGLGAAVAHELADVVSPHLPIRLLRMLLPLALVVTAVFLAALPFRGLGDLFGGLSVAATMMGMAFAAATLVSAALDRDDAAAADGRLMQVATQILSLMLPVLALLAVYSVSERVSQYGWSPDRLAAMTAAVVLAGYGITYAGAVLVQREWMGRIRQANVMVALGVLVLALAWLSPLLNPQKLAVASQVARYEQGQVSADALDLWSIGRGWGRPGRDGLARLAELRTPGGPALEARLAALEAAPNRYAFETAAPSEDRQTLVASVLAAMPVRPEGRALTPEALAEIAPGTLQDWRDGCDRRTPGGAAGCLALLADLLPGRAGLETLVFVMRSDSFVQVSAFGADGVPVGRFGPTWLSGAGQMPTAPAIIDDLLQGAFTVAPTRLNALRINDAELIILP